MEESTPKTTDQADGEKPEIHRLSDALSFRLSRMSAINDRNGSHHFRTELGINLSEWRVLGLVAEMTPATTRWVRDTLLMDRGSLSRAVKQLCARGLLVSQISPTDKRQTELLLTQAGRAMHRTGLAFLNTRNRSMTSVLSPQEHAIFEKTLDVLIAHNEALLGLNV